MTIPEPPSVPEAILARGDWEKQDERTETFFEISRIRIHGTTRQYDDRQSRNALQSVTEDIDGQVRFVAVTRLGFEPSLSGVRSTMVAPILRTAIRQTFPEQLEQRGPSNIEHRRSERLRLPDGNRAHLEEYTATDSLDDTTFELICCVGSWLQNTDAFVVSGGYPRTAIAHQLRIGTDDEVLTRSPAQYRDEFVSLLRGVADCNS